MKLRLLAVLVSALLSGSEALAWSTSSSADTVDVTTKTVYRYDTTTKTDSDGQATSACSLLEASLDRSTGDTSADCQVTLQSCDTASGTEASRDCVPLPVTFPSEGTYIPINSPKAYTRVKVDVSPAGGDTCRVDLRCTTLANTSYSSGAATPGGSDTYVQYNDGGVLGGDSGLTFNETSNTLSIGGALEVPTITLDILGAYGLEGGAAAGSYFITTNGDPSSNISLLVDEALATDYFVFKAATQTLTNKTVNGASASGATRASGSNVIQRRQHATDCSSITDGKVGEECQDTDDGKLWICRPSSGDCDTVGEWEQQARSSEVLPIAEIEDQVYTPATDGPGATDDWNPAWAAADPSTLKGALDRLSRGVRAMWASLFGGYDVVVDLTNSVNWQGINFYVGINGSGAQVATGASVAYSANPCVQIQAALQPFNNETDLVRKIKIVGSATAEFADTYDFGPFRACWAVIPSTATNASGYPTLANTNIDLGTAQERLTIEWDDVYISVGMTGQSEPVVVGLYGGGYLFGNSASGNSLSGAFSQGLTETGRLMIQRADDTDGSWLAGRIVNTSTSTFLESTTSTVLYFNNNTLRADRSNLDLRLTGNASDNDDIGFMTSSGWGNAYGKTTVERLGTGVRIHATNGSTLKDWYVQNNDNGIVYGDFTAGGDNPILATTCVCNTSGGSCAAGSNCTQTTTDSANGIKWIGLIAETNNYGQLICIDCGSENAMIQSRFETGSVASGGISRHQILFGAGQCGDETNTAEDYKTCGGNSECNATATCTTAAAWKTAEHFLISNTTLPGDLGFYGAASCTSSGNPAACCTGSGAGADCENYDGLFIGRGTNQNNQGMIDITNSNINASTVSSGVKKSFGFVSDSGANNRQQIRLTSNYVNDVDAHYPNYKGIHDPGSVRYWFEVNETGVDADEGKCMPRINAGTTTLISCSGSATSGAEYLLDRPSAFYARGGCIAYSATGWDEELAMWIQEIDSSGNIDTALTAPLRVPNSGTAPTPFTLYTKKDASNPQQAYGVLGASDAVAFRLVVADDSASNGDITDTTNDAVVTMKCFVDVLYDQTQPTIFGYGAP